MNKPRLACWVWKVTYYHSQMSSQLASYPEMWVRLSNQPYIRQHTRLNTWVWISSKIIRACPVSNPPDNMTLAVISIVLSQLTWYFLLPRWDGWMASLDSNDANLGKLWEMLRNKEASSKLQSIGLKVRHELYWKHYSKIITRISRKESRGCLLLLLN